ncbi:beta-lactamase family protein [Amycolatopsis bartoniae]|nr:beta-lactamase family protein [Amycolatopsis bartoniae]
MSRHVESGAIPGAVTMVSRRGEVHVDVVGAQAYDGAPLRRDSLFRISSMTKPITAVAALTLVEECVLRLDDPLDDVLPELADRRVLRDVAGPLDDTVPARRPITLRDLLTFRMGFGMLPESSPLQAAAMERSVAVGPPNPAEYPAPDEWLRRLGELPLAYQPGERWLYHTGADVLGVLLERVCGKPLDDVLGERVFGRLDMRDTGFYTSDVDRLVTAYGPDDSVFDEPSGQWSKRPPFLSGGGGLLSTVDDLSAFAHALLGGGGEVLSRRMVELMTTDQLTPEQKALSGFFPGYFDNRGWGFGVGVVTRRDGIARTPGQFGWDGGLGTSWWADPKEELTAVLLTQRAGFPDQNPVVSDFWTTVYQAVV